jgi:hypothetical protein
MGGFWKKSFFDYFLLFFNNYLYFSRNQNTMTKFLQSLLTLTILYLAMKMCVAGFFIAKLDKARDFDPGPGLRNSVSFESHIGDWPFSLGRKYIYDSVSGTSRMLPVLGIRGVKPSKKIDDGYYMKDRDIGDNRVYFDQESYMTFIPLTEKKFSGCLALFIALFILSSLLFVYIWLLLFRFVRAAGKKAFFDKDNARRLAVIGGFILFLGVLSPFRLQISLWFMEWMSGLSGVDIRLNESGIQVYYIIAGLLLLVIAEAFRKGNQLQTEQDYTI